MGPWKMVKTGHKWLLLKSRFQSQICHDGSAFQVLLPSLSKTPPRWPPLRPTLPPNSRRWPTAKNANPTPCWVSATVTVITAPGCWTVGTNPWSTTASTPTTGWATMAMATADTTTECSILQLQKNFTKLHAILLFFDLQVMDIRRHNFFANKLEFLLMLIFKNYSLSPYLFPQFNRCETNWLVPRSVQNT